MAANKLHKYAINGCLIFIGYQLFAFLRDYNDFFLHARQINQLDQDIINNNGPINERTSKDEWVWFVCCFEITNYSCLLFSLVNIFVQKTSYWTFLWTETFI